MAKGIVINFLSDVRDFLRGTSDVEEALDDVVDSLDDVAKDGDKAAEKLADSFKDNMKEASRAAREAGDGIGTSFKKGADQAVQSSEVVKKEAIANLSEVASSFDGSIQSVGDLVQGTLGGIVQDLGAWGIAAGVAGAASVGLVIKSYEDTQAELLATRERVNELTQAMIDQGDATVPLDFIIENLRKIIGGADDAAKSFKDIKKQADDLGLSAGVLATAYAGGEEAIDGQLGALQDLIDEEYKHNEAVVKGTADFDKNSAQRISDLLGIKAELSNVKEEIDLAQEAEQNWLATGGEEILVKKGLIDSVNTAYDDLAGSVDDFIVEESGLFDTAAYITAMQEREQSLKDYQETLATSGLSNDAMNFLNDQGVEAASKMLEGYKSASPDTKKELNRIWSEASKDASGQVKTNLDKVINEKRTAEIGVKVDSEQAVKTLDQIFKDRTITAKVKYVDRFGKEVP